MSRARIQLQIDRLRGRVTTLWHRTYARDIRRTAERKRQQQRMALVLSKYKKYSMLLKGLGSFFKKIPKGTTIICLNKQEKHRLMTAIRYAPNRRKRAKWTFK